MSSFKDKLKRAAISTTAFIDKAKPIVNDAYNVITTVNGSSTPFQKVMGVASFTSSMNHRVLGSLLASKSSTKEIYFLNSPNLTENVVRFFERKKVIARQTDGVMFRPDSYAYSEYLIGNFYGVDLVFGRPSSRNSGERHRAIAPKEMTGAQVQALIARKLWDLIDDALHYTSDEFTAYKDTVCDKYVVSDEADKLEASIKLAVAKKIPRSILLCGPPGSGKTELANYITTKLFKRRLYIDSHVNSEVIQNLVINLAPDCVVVNDFSVTGSLRGLLPVLEVLRRHVPIVLLTTNSTEELPGALIRPGRVDEVITLDKMHGPAMVQLVKNILGVLYTDDIYDIVKDWPMAFIQELKARVELGRDFHVELSDLQTRLARNDDNNDSKSYGDSAQNQVVAPSPGKKANNGL